jgi:ureidoacrylate peracid hydrolase
MSGRLGEAARLAHVPVLSTFESKIDPEHTALIVVDVQNDFCADDGMMAREGLDVTPVQRMADRLPRLVDAARAAGALVVFVRNVYSTEANLYLSDTWLEQAARRRGDSYTRRPVCAAGSWEAAFYGDLAPGPVDALVTKHRFSAFHNTDLETILRAHGIRTLVMTGVATNVCVETTARDGFVRDYYIVFLDDGTACYSDAEHQATLQVIDRYFGEVSDIATVVKAWDGRSVDPAATADE